MRILGLTVGLASGALLAVTVAAEAAERHSGKWKRGAHAERHYHGYGTRHGLSRRAFDRLPIRITKPDNMRHYKYQDYPAWAAEAMEPKKWF